jgi:NAD(P)H dehydrogenase (quinone)
MGAKFKAEALSNGSLPWLAGVCMAKIIIVYDSKTGHTEKMAFAVAEGAKQVEGIEVTVKKVDQTSLKDLLAADGIIMGSPTYYGQMSAKLKAFIDESVKIHGKLEGKVGAAFTSSGGTATGAETTLLSILKAMLIHGMIVQGRADDKHYGAAAVGKPDKKELEYCRELGKRTASLVVKLKRGG